jgi:hypothetical protein
VEHFIETEGWPVAAKYRRLDLVKLRAAQAEFADLERQGIIRRSSSNWSSPLHEEEEARWVLAAVRRFPPVKFADPGGQIHMP